MYNLYNFEPKQEFLENFRKNREVYKLIEEIGALTLVIVGCFLWFFV